MEKPANLVIMHRWDSRLRHPPAGVTPLLRRDASTDPTPAQLRGPGWRRTSHGCYVPSVVELTPGQRVIEGAELLPPGGAVSGWGSAYWRGVRLLDGTMWVRNDPLLLCLGPTAKIRNRPGVRLSRDRLAPDEVEDVRGVSCTVPLRTAFDGARLAADGTSAVVFIDMMLSRAARTTRMRRAHERGLKRDRRLDQWTLQAPPWW